jgi:KDEL-tailed cysteine endopeptidase
MKSFILALLVVGAFCSIHEQLMRDLYAQWKQTHNKAYMSDTENDYRFTVFKRNYLDILQANQQGDNAKLGLNKFADLTSEEFGAKYTGYYPKPTNAIEKTFDVSALPASVNWVTAGAVTPVKNQGDCGSCWAFSSTGSLEGLYFINNTNLASFSEQNLVDCVTEDDGCDGGEMTDALTYSAQNGIETEADYPYTGEDGTCTFDSSIAYHPNDGYYAVKTKSEQDLLAAIVGQPISIGVEADQLAFQFYSSGVIKSGCGDAIDHGVLAVGYTTVDGTQAYYVKNSWGADWGDNGFLYISTNPKPNEGNGVCGILSGPVYPYKN